MATSAPRGSTSGKLSVDLNRACSWDGITSREGFTVRTELFPLLPCGVVLCCVVLCCVVLCCVVLCCVVLCCVVLCCVVLLCYVSIFSEVRGNFFENFRTWLPFVFESKFRVVWCLVLWHVSLPHQILSISTPQIWKIHGCTP